MNEANKAGAENSVYKEV